MSNHETIKNKLKYLRNRPEVFARLPNGSKVFKNARVLWSKQNITRQRKPIKTNDMMLIDNTNCNIGIGLDALDVLDSANGINNIAIGNNVGYSSTNTIEDLFYVEFREYSFEEYY